MHIIIQHIYTIKHPSTSAQTYTDGHSVHL